MKRATSANAQAQSTDLGIPHIDARRSRTTHGNDVPVIQGVDDRLLDPVDELAHADAEAAQVDHRVADNLSGPVIGHLASTLDADNRNVARCQHMLRLARLAKRENRLVL